MESINFTGVPGGQVRRYLEIRMVQVLCKPGDGMDLFKESRIGFGKQYPLESPSRRRIGWACLGPCFHQEIGLLLIVSSASFEARPRESY